MNDISKQIKGGLIKLPGGISCGAFKSFKVFFLLCFMSLILMLSSTDNPFSAMDTFGPGRWRVVFFIYLLIAIIYTVLYVAGRSIALRISRKIIKSYEANGGGDGTANS